MYTYIYVYTYVVSPNFILGVIKKRRRNLALLESLVFGELSSAARSRQRRDRRRALLHCLSGDARGCPRLSEYMLYTW